jgi:acetoin utilization deacetylase AcuC-like enzyme
MRRLVIVDDELFTQHTAPFGHPESEARLLAARTGLWAGAKALSVERLPEREASHAELCRVHTPSYVAQLEATRGRNGHLDGDTYFAPQTSRAATCASGGAIALVDAVLGGADYGFGFVRPPGHHALPERAMGFCLYNHAAVAASHALANGVQRVLILDWDVHHGNGTQDVFYARPEVLYVSLHQSPQYPGTGALRETGEGEGAGFTVNVPLRAGADERVYVAAFRQLIAPIVRQFAPELVIVSAGYDAHRLDPLGGMALSDAGFGALTGLLCAAIGNWGRQRLVFLLEGGYDAQGLKGGVEHTVLALSEASSGFEQDPIELAPPAWQQTLQECKRVHAAHWQL